MEYVRLTSASEVWCPGRKLLTQRSRFLSPSSRWTFVDPEIWRGPRSRWTQILDAFTPSAWISGLDPRIWRGSGSRWTQILEELLPSAWIASYFPHPGRTRVAGPPNRLAPRSIAKVAVFLLEIADFEQILCSPPFGSPLPTPPGAGTWELLNEANPIPVL